jgi:hypothetical protein
MPGFDKTHSERQRKKLRYLKMLVQQMSAEEYWKALWKINKRGMEAYLTKAVDTNIP